MSKYDGHTKGPWLVSSSTLICTEAAKVVANCTPMGVPGIELGIEECAINARLIADAPKLLAERDEAVELLREAIGTQISAGFHKSSYAGMIAFIEGLEGEK